MKRKRSNLIICTAGAAVMLSAALGFVLNPVKAQSDSEKAAKKAPNPTATNIPTSNASTSNGLQTGTFVVPQGRITVIVPDNMRVGDKISGTILVEPNGETQEEKDKNGRAMADYVVVLPFSGVQPKVAGIQPEATPKPDETIKVRPIILDIGDITNVNPAGPTRRTLGFFLQDPSDNSASASDGTWVYPTPSSQGVVVTPEPKNTVPNVLIPKGPDVRPNSVIPTPMPTPTPFEFAGQPEPNPTRNPWLMKPATPTPTPVALLNPDGPSGNPKGGVPTPTPLTHHTGFVAPPVPSNAQPPTGKPGQAAATPQTILNPEGPLANPELYRPSVSVSPKNQLQATLFLIPNQSSAVKGCGRSRGLLAINESCRPISQLLFKAPDEPITINPTSPSMPSFTVPVIGQTGNPIVITGPFDGNSTNTDITVKPNAPVTGNSSLPTQTTPIYAINSGYENNGFYILAESPRQIVVAVPSNVTGPTQITVSDGGIQTTAPFRNVGVNLSAPQTNMTRGQKTQMTVQVTGLQGITQPVPLTLSCTGAVTMSGGTSQHLTIQPSQVNQAGIYTTTRDITGVQAGGWGASATVMPNRR